jgi:hypothetical protein
MGQDYYQSANRIITTDIILQPPYSSLTLQQWKALVEFYNLERVQPFDGKEADITDPRVLLDEIVHFAAHFEPDEEVTECPIPSHTIDSLERILEESRKSS